MNNFIQMQQEAHEQMKSDSDAFKEMFKLGLIKVDEGGNVDVVKDDSEQQNLRDSW